MTRAPTPARKRETASKPRSWRVFVALDYNGEPMWGTTRRERRLCEDSTGCHWGIKRATLTLDEPKRKADARRKK